MTILDLMIIWKKCIMKIKNLVLSMTYEEAYRYTLNKPQWNIPTAQEAMDIDIEDCQHDKFWIQDMLAGRKVIYNKKNQCYEISHPNIKHNVVLVEDIVF
jgi:hypothetical protein